MEPTDVLTAIGVGASLLAIGPAFVFEGRRRRSAPQGSLPFTWGYYQGFGAFFFGVIILWLSIANGGDTLVIGITVALSYCSAGIAVIRRRRWGWVVTTILTLNPLLWIVHYVYGRNRWSEFNAQAPHMKRVQLRFDTNGVRRWHPGKMVMLWGGAIVILLIFMTAVGPFHEGTAFVIWAVCCSPLYHITWVWFGAREGNTGR